MFKAVKPNLKNSKYCKSDIRGFKYKIGKFYKQRHLFSKFQNIVQDNMIHGGGFHCFLEEYANRDTKCIKVLIPKGTKVFFGTWQGRHTVVAQKIKLLTYVY